MLKADPSLTPADRNRLLALLRNHGKADAEPAATEPRIIRRHEAARRLGCSVRAVDNWTRAGILQKVTLPGRTRAAGFREADVAALIAGKGASR
jgi:hypothetical protein